MLSSLSPSVLSPVTMIGMLAAAGIMVVFGMLVQKEFSGARSGSQRIKLLGQVMIISIAPLLIAFILFMIKNMSQMMR